eukprot:1154945-Pelagomonas_calceolata.AAC.2
MEPLKELGLDTHRAIKLSKACSELRAHSDQYAYKLLAPDALLRRLLTTLINKLAVKHLDCGLVSLVTLQPLYTMELLSGTHHSSTFGRDRSSLSSEFSGFSIYYPVYGDKAMTLRPTTCYQLCHPLNRGYCHLYHNVSARICQNCEDTSPGAQLEASSNNKVNCGNKFKVPRSLSTQSSWICTKLHAHSMQYAMCAMYKLTSTRRAIEHRNILAVRTLPAQFSFFPLFSREKEAHWLKGAWVPSTKDEGVLTKV